MLTQIENEQHWHQLRKAHIGASDVAALFNQSPWKTAFSLYHEKLGDAPAPEVNDANTEVGSIMESAIGKLYAKRNNVEMYKISTYAECDDEMFLGATLDYKFEGYDGFPIAVEIKHVSTWAWRDMGWNPEEDYLPPHVELQLIAQMLCTGYKHGVVVAFCDGELYQFHRHMDEERTKTLADGIIKAVQEMARRLKERDEPDVLGNQVDLAIQALIVREDPQKPVLDCSDDEAANEMLHELSYWQGMAYQSYKMIDTLKAKITQLMVRKSNTEGIAPQLMTRSYFLKRTTAEMAEVTTTRKAHVRVTYKVKERTDSQAQKYEGYGKELMAG